MSASKSQPQVTTGNTTPLALILSQISLPLLVESLTSAGPAVSSSSVQSLFQSITLLRPTSSIPETPSYRMPTTVKCDQAFLTPLTKGIVAVTHRFRMIIDKPQVLF